VFSAALAPFVLFSSYITNSVRPEGNFKDGYFQFEVDSELLKNVKNLQIDIVQDGRHIGTFLVKKEGHAEFFIIFFSGTSSMKIIFAKLRLCWHWTE